MPLVGYSATSAARITMTSANRKVRRPTCWHAGRSLLCMSCGSSQIVGLPRPLNAHKVGDLTGFNGIATYNPGVVCGISAMKPRAYLVPWVYTNVHRIHY